VGLRPAIYVSPWTAATAIARARPLGTCTRQHLGVVRPGSCLVSRNGFAGRANPRRCPDILLTLPQTAMSSSNDYANCGNPGVCGDRFSAIAYRQSAWRSTIGPQHQGSGPTGGVIADVNPGRISMYREYVTSGPGPHRIWSGGTRQLADQWECHCVLRGHSALHTAPTRGQVWNRWLMVPRRLRYPP